MATAAQLENLAKARAARAAKRVQTEGNPAAIEETIVVTADFPRVAGKYDASIEALILLMREQISDMGDDLRAMRDKLDVLWLERENQTTARRMAEGFKIPYRCTECGTVVEALAPQFRTSPEQAVRCPNPIHNGGLTPMDYTL